MDGKPKIRKIGAIWNKVSKSGKDYLSISIEIGGLKYNLAAFKNTYKEHDRQPDWNITPPSNPPEPVPPKYNGVMSKEDQDWIDNIK